MRFLLGLVGAAIGFGVANEERALGAMLGFAVAWLAGTVSRLRRELTETREELHWLRGRGERLPVEAPKVPEPVQAPPVEVVDALPVTPEPVVAAVPVSPPQSPPPRPSPLVAAVQSWFTQGNVPVKAGVLVL